jgi:hypothetical protein
MGVDQAGENRWIKLVRSDTIFTFFGRGTIAPSAQIRCEIALARSRMRDLEELFDVQLHH